MTNHLYKDFFVKDNFKVINCESCGFWHVYPIPTNEILSEYYQSQYHQDSNQHGDMKDKKEDPDGYYRIKYNDKLTNLNRLLSGDAEKSILDLGAGYGDFLDFMRENGWTVKGIEASEYCRQDDIWERCNISQCFLEDVKKINLGNYTVITLNTVLEHYPYPEQLLFFIKENLMNSHTILHVEVPNDFSFLQDIVNVICNPQKYWLHPLGHLNYWTHETLSKFVTRLGFKIELIESTFPLEIMAMLCDDYITYPEKGRNIHMKRVEFEKKFYDLGCVDLKLKLYQAFAQIGVGREILLYLRKA